MNKNSVVIPPRWSSECDVNKGDLFFIQDNTHLNEGWGVMMKEPIGVMILFTDLRKEIAEQFKERLEAAIAEYFEV